MKLVFKQKSRRKLSLLFYVLVIFSFTACNNFLVRSLEKDHYDEIVELSEKDKLFVVHQAGYAAIQLKDVEVDSEYLNGTLAPLQQNVFYRKNRDKKFNKSEKAILNEVHIYLKEDVEAYDMGSQKIALAHIDEFQVIKYNTAKDIPAYVLGAGAVAAFIAIVSTKQKPKPDPEAEGSCPYVYAHNGNDYEFKGEVLSGAIASNLERDDYMPLPARVENNNSYKIKVTNELEEIHYLDLAELIVVSHPKENKVLLDKYGQPHSYGSLSIPNMASTYSGENIISTLSSKDRNVFFFNDENYSENGVELKFDRPANASAAKLVMRGKNPLWADYVYGIYADKYGDKYDKWMERQETKPPSERMDKILGHDIQLSVYIKDGLKWKLVDYVMPVGVYAPRDFVIPIDLANVVGDEIEIKIETGFMFWELDHVGIDYSSNSKLNIISLMPIQVNNSSSKDFMSAIKEREGEYMVHDKVGDETEFVFNIPKASMDQIQSVFFHCRGYYETMTKFEGKTDRYTLRKFRNPGYFSEFSRSIYLQTLNKNYYDMKHSSN